MNLFRNTFMVGDDRAKAVLNTFYQSDSVESLELLVADYKRRLDGLSLKGEKVALLLGSARDILALLVAVNDFGGTVVALNPQFRREDLVSILAHADPHVIFAPKQDKGFEFKSLLSEWAVQTGKETTLFLLDEQSEWEKVSIPGDARDPESNIGDLICYTSGSTGVPKGLVLEVPAFACTQEIVRDFGDIQPTDRVLCFLSYSTYFGLASLTNLIRRRAKALVPDSFDVKSIAELMIKHRCNKITTTPSIFKAIYMYLEHLEPQALEMLEWAALGGEPVTTEFIEQFKLTKNCHFVAAYGCSEVGGVLYCHPRESLDYMLFENVDYQLVNQELAFKAGSAFKTYYKNEELANEIRYGDGWILTGDIAEITEDRKIRIVGRSKSMIKKQGLQVIPAEVERLLSKHDCVKDIVVMGAPHDIYGEQVVAFVVPASDISPGELKAYCRGKIADYKIPDRFIFLEEIPVSQAKIDRLELKKRL